MAASGLTIDEIYYYFKENGGVVKNRDVVHHFKRYLTDPLSKDDARAKFKRYVNTLAQTKTENEEKYLFLKRKFLVSELPPSQIDVPHSPISAQYDPRNSIGIPISPISNVSQIDHGSPLQRTPLKPPPYRPPPPVTSSPAFDTVSLNSWNSASMFDLDTKEGSTCDLTPQAPPRRRSLDKQKSLEEEWAAAKKEEKKVETVHEENVEPDDKKSVSVRERLQRFNRMASTDDELGASPRSNKGDRSKSEKGVDEDDGASVTSLDAKKCVEWYVTASRGDLQELVKLAKEEPRLINKKDPFTTVLHWGAKHGNGEIIKYFAGTCKMDVNCKTNGGYTPLHFAGQFGHTPVFKLLIEVYKADPNIRDYSGRTPGYYLAAKQSKGQGKENNSKIKGRKKNSSDKDLGFLRIGSLNVRVKKTTEAFSNFLGVGSSGSVNPLDTMEEKIHKGWGSADNLNQEQHSMPAPKGYIKKKSKRPLEPCTIGIQSTPTTPKQVTRNVPKLQHKNDSDSDSAAGFDSTWKK